MFNINAENWYEDGVESEDNYQIEEYDITTSPNDFNVKTIFDFLRKSIPFRIADRNKN